MDVAIVIDFAEEGFFDALHRARWEHDENTHDQRKQGRVEGHAQPRRHRADRVLHDVQVHRGRDRVREAADGFADAEHGAYEAEDGNRPDENLCDGVAGIDRVGT